MSGAAANRADDRLEAIEGIGESDGTAGMAADRRCADLQRPSVGKAIAGQSGIGRKPAAARAMVARLMQQGEDQRIHIDEWVECEPAVNTNETGASQTKRLCVDDPGLGIDLIFDAGERASKFGQKNVQHAGAALRTAKSDIAWQSGSVQHLNDLPVCAYGIFRTRIKSEDCTKSSATTTVTAVWKYIRF
jgi:hypothetical protein